MSGACEPSGLLLLNKPVGLTSNRALQRARGIYRAKRAGHTGSLDPLASGLLPVCLGQMCRFSSLLLNANKGYRASILLGTRTDTDDTDGQVLEQRSVQVTEQELEQALQQFRGILQQVPPIYSAIRQGGERLYKKARRGEVVQAEARDVQVHRLEFISFEEQRLELDILCSKGTYIRAIARDLGELLGCGGCVASLQRTLVGDFLLENAVDLAQLQALRDSEQGEALQMLLLPMTDALSHLPLIQLDGDRAQRLLQGISQVLPPCQESAQYPENDALVRLVTGVGELIGLGRVVASSPRACTIAPHRMLPIDATGVQTASMRGSSSEK